ncbi:uncharacterized protein LOC120394969 isoform X2 [Mauremys reevesii]|uniref:uncharacterized protein LOC120394969 isoform X2 n=1 Tax=Mauremys reevesii TaxID=260615 RepID=UPI00193F9AE4|nr:uncharacterized protein LOC120394969 isoform X2 [Mauremys reevesii]
MLKKFLFTSTLLGLVLAFPREIPDTVTSYSDDTTASPSDFTTSYIVETTSQTNDFTRFSTEEATAETVDFTTSYIEETMAEPKDITPFYTENSTLEATEDPVTSLSGEYKTGSAEPTTFVTGEEFKESSTSGSGDLWIEASTLTNEAYPTGTANESRTISTELYTLDGPSELSTSLNGDSVTEGPQGSSNTQDNVGSDQP